MVDPVTQGAGEARFGEPAPLLVAGRLGGAGRGLQAAFAVAVEQVLIDGAGFEDGDRAVGQYRHLALGMLGPPLRALPVGGGEIDGECLVGQVEFFAEPDIAHRAGALGVVDLNHGDCSQGISRSGRYTSPLFPWTGI